MTWELAEDGRYRYNSFNFMRFIFEEEPKEEVSPQLELVFPNEGCRHEFHDDDGPKGMGHYCSKCDFFVEVSFLDKKHKKTYQEVYEIMQQDRHLKF